MKLAGTSVKIDVFGHKDNTMPYVEEEEGVDCDYLIKVGISFGCLGFHSSCSSEKRETTVSHTHTYTAMTDDLMEDVSMSPVASPMEVEGKNRIASCMGSKL